MAAPLLDLNTLVERETVTIDGTRYDMRSDMELSLFELAALERSADKVHAFSRELELTPEQRTEYEQLLERAVAIIMVAPPDVLARLRTGQREAILWTFIALSRPGLVPSRATAEPPTKARPKTRSASARASRGSTVARRKRG